MIVNKMINVSLNHVATVYVCWWLGTAINATKFIHVSGLARYLVNNVIINIFGIIWIELLYIHNCMREEENSFCIEK